MPPFRASPLPVPTPNPAPPTRSRQNSIQNVNAENNKARPTSAPNKPNGNTVNTVNPVPPQNSSLRNGTTAEPKPPKEAIVTIKTENPKKETERTETVPAPPTTTVNTITNAVPVPPTTSSKKDAKKPDENERKNDRKSESLPPAAPTPTVTTKSGRASKPSTPSLATFQEAAPPRSRSSRNNDGAGTGKKNQKKTGPTIHATVAQLADEDMNSSMQGDEDEVDIDADEPTYCYCNGVSYGEMVACDADECPREWFHLECVGLKVAPTSKAKWYCEDCKERLKMGGKKSNGR
jgi:hypothetical protein